MAAAQADNPTRGALPAKPAITVRRDGVVIGSGFLANHDVTIEIIRAGESVSDYLTYTTDRNGHLHAELPATAVAGMLHITATDHRTDPDGACGRLWSNSYPFSVGNT